jgi:hypothetical protein
MIPWCFVSRWHRLALLGWAVFALCACSTTPARIVADVGGAADVSDAAEVDSAAGGTDSSAIDSGSDALAGLDDGASTADVQGANCGPRLLGFLQCVTGVHTVSACSVLDDDVPPGDATSAQRMAAVKSCAVTLCEDATQGTARAGCIWEKCLDKISTCADFGQGESDCLTAASCAGRCNQNNPACWIGCMQDAKGSEVQGFGPIAGCILGTCGGLQGEARSACIQANCTKPAASCRGPAGGLDCTFTEGCLAKCPPVVPGSANDCRDVCGVLASGVGLAGEATYTTCKKQCAGVIDKFMCYEDKCSAEQDGCFGGAGTANCQAIYKCVKDQCEGIGGAASCIAGCVLTGNAKAKDGWVHYEGCILLHLDSPQARNAGCSFPYDEATCLEVIKGFCSGESASCFKPQ